jgi:hypothetical protein
VSLVLLESRIPDRGGTQDHNEKETSRSPAFRRSIRDFALRFSLFKANFSVLQNAKYSKPKNGYI